MKDQSPNSVSATLIAAPNRRSSVAKTPQRPTLGFGERVKRVRLERGFRTISDFASHLDSKSLSLAILKNIESGRRKEVSVHHLLELADGLRVTPLVLLFDMRDPLGQTDLPGLPPRLAARTNEDLEYWVALNLEDARFDEVWERRSEEEAALVFIRRVRRAAAEVAQLEGRYDIRQFTDRVDAIKGRPTDPPSRVPLNRARYRQTRLEDLMRKVFGTKLPSSLTWEGRRLY